MIMKPLRCGSLDDLEITQEKVVIGMDTKVPETCYSCIYYLPHHNACRMKGGHFCGIGKKMRDGESLCAQNV